MIQSFHIYAYFVTGTLPFISVYLHVNIMTKDISN